MASTSMTISPKGKVTACRVTESTGSPTLDKATCDYFRKEVRYAPVMGSDGKPTSSNIMGRLKWRLPDSPRRQAP